jgi:hypothetical protein
MTHGADWTMTVEKNVTVVVRHHAVPVVAAQYCFWGANWAYAGADFSIDVPADKLQSFAAKVPKLGITGIGEIQDGGDNSVVITYYLEAAEDLQGITGGLEFHLDLDSPSFGGKPAAPAVLPDNKGWEWRVSGDGPVRVSFDAPIGEVYFEKGDLQRIRVIFLKGNLAKGRHTFKMTVALPSGGRRIKAAWERYDRSDPASWYHNALPSDWSPVDLSFLNDGDRPAGRRGRIKAQDERLVFEDGTEARFWGTNIAAYSLFADPKTIQQHAHRLAALGYNLVRLHHHDSMSWVRPCVIDVKAADSRHLDAAALDRIDWWIKCLKDEGIYVWLDLHVGRQFKAADGITQGYDEIARHNAEAKGFCYFNPSLQALMQEFNAAYLSHINAYTHVAYKDEPAIAAMLVTNENDLVAHFGNLMLPDKNDPVHNKMFMARMNEYCARTGASPRQAWRTWEPGPAKLFLADQEHTFNQLMIGHLRRLGAGALIVTTNLWSPELYALASLSDGDVIDVHAYGGEEELGTNPRYAANFLGWIGEGRVTGKPVSITEWNLPYATTDRFIAPMYLASIAALQGWNAPMIFNYSQDGLGARAVQQWSTYVDPALTGLMPAAALAFRRGDVAPARTAYCVQPSADKFFNSHCGVDTAAAIRTLLEQSKVSIALPATKELPWMWKASAAGSRSVTDLDRDFIPPGHDTVRSDTGQLERNWGEGTFTVDSPKTACAEGWIGGKTIALGAVTCRITTAKAAVVVTSLDDQPIQQSHRLLVTAVARALGSGADANLLPFLSEPVCGTLSIASDIEGLHLVALTPAKPAKPGSPALTRGDGHYELPLTAGAQTHWFLLTDR